MVLQNDQTLKGRTGRVVVTLTGMHHVSCFDEHLNDKVAPSVALWIAAGARHGVTIRQVIDTVCAPARFVRGRGVSFLHTMKCATP